MLDGSEVDEALIRYLSGTSALSPDAARRCVQEVLAYYAESIEAFVVRRHRELQHEGQLKNDGIYERIIHEAAARRFAVAPLSPRQVRRMIYG